MGRKPDQQRIEAVLRVIEENDGNLRAADIAEQLGLAKSSVTRLLPAIDAEQKKWLIEDDQGFLSILKP